ncbi:MAG TPA: peptidylprolyl isomerase [Thermoanaerobaculia bacterium]
MLKVAISTSLLLTLLVFAAEAESAKSATATGASQIFAQVNGDPISAADLKAAFVGKHGGHTVFLGGDAEIRRFLDVVINERLLIQEAYNLGLEEDALVKPEVDTFRDRKSVEYLLKSEIDDKSAPTEEEIRAAWEQAKELFLAKEMVVDTEGEARAVRESLVRGADFDLLARTCSIAQTRTRGGSLNPFTWGSRSEQIEKVVMQLEPGELSPVFQTPEGWTIIQLTNKLEAQRPELDDRVRQRLTAKLRERKRETRMEALSAELWRAYSARIVTPSIEPMALLRALRTDPEAGIASWDGGELSVEEAFTEAELRMWAAFLPGRATEKINTTLRSAVNTALVALEAKKRNIADVPEVAAAVDKFEAGLMERALYAKHVLPAVKVSDDELRSQYEKEKGRMLIGEKRRVAHIAVATEEEAAELQRRIQRGEEFGELVKQHSLDTTTTKKGGDLGWIEKGKVDQPFEPLFKLPQGGVSNPIKAGAAWHLVRVSEIEPERSLSFEEAKQKIHESMFEKKKHDARQIWIEKLRDAGEITVDDAAIASYVQANPYEAPNQ